VVSVTDPYGRILGLPIEKQNHETKSDTAHTQMSGTSCESFRGDTHFNSKCFRMSFKLLLSTNGTYSYVPTHILCSFSCNHTADSPTAGGESSRCFVQCVQSQDKFRMKLLCRREQVQTKSFISRSNVWRSSLFAFSFWSGYSRRGLQKPHSYPCQQPSIKYSYGCMWPYKSQFTS
jgi:hypothetical protein